MQAGEVTKILEEKIGKKLKERPGIASEIGAAVAVELSGEGGGRWLIDFSKDKIPVTMDSKAQAITTITMDLNVFERMLKREVDPQMAFLTGKIKVDGNLGVAIKIGQLLA